MFQRLSAVLLILVSGLSACTIHRIDIQQGNVITIDMVKQLKPGMSRQQVNFVMGSPMIKDPFHANRWDFLFTLQPGHTRKITEYKRVSVFFEGDAVQKIDVENVN